MGEFALPLLFALAIWWSATAVVMFLDGLPRSTYRWTLLGTTALQLVALYGLWATRDDSSVAGAYVAFACAVLTWGWQEVFFLTGAITGTRRQACAPHCSGWRHFRHGVQAIKYHELSLLAAGALLTVLCWNAPYRIGLWTYLVLWGMRQSAKLNLFLGVRNLGVEFLPQHLAYLQSFFRRRVMNALFPWSMLAGTALVALLARRTLHAASGDFETAGFALLASIALLGVLEHCLLMVPVPTVALWRWSLRSHRRSAEAAAASRGG
ncbi:MAG: putative photosynthetic complex assembly protein PuhE [Steroidobacteraceae bacterium]